MQLENLVVTRVILVILVIQVIQEENLYLTQSTGILELLVVVLPSM